jgi:hypothetical protein
MRFMKLLGIMLTVTIISSLTASAIARPPMTLTPISGAAGTIVAIKAYVLGEGSCIISSSPNGLISNPVCTLTGHGATESASFTVACAPAGLYTVTVTGAEEDEQSVVFNNEGGACAVGGIVMPVNTVALVSPWLAAIGLVGCIGTIVVVAMKRR